MCKKVGDFDQYFDGPSWFRYWAKLVGPTDGWAELGAVYMVPLTWDSMKCDVF